MQDWGHYRGMGCAACHSVYSNEGYYEGGDPSIDKESAGHLLVHDMQGTRKLAYTLNDKDLSGVANLYLCCMSFRWTTYWACLSRPHGIR